MSRAFDLRFVLVPRKTAAPEASLSPTARLILWNAACFLLERDSKASSITERPGQNPAGEHTGAGGGDSARGFGPVR